MCDNSKFYLIYQGVRVGHPDLGYMRVNKQELRDDSIDWQASVEQRFQRFVRRTKGLRVVVADGVARVV